MTIDTTPAGVEATLSATPYQVVLAGMTVPLAVVCTLDAVGGLVLGLIGAPLLGLGWTVFGIIVDVALQSLYRRLRAGAATVESSVGLRRLALLVAFRSLLWVSGPVAFTLASHSAAGVIQTAVTAFGLVAISVSAGWTSRYVLTAQAAPAALAMVVEAVALATPGQFAGLLIGVAIFGAMMALISNSTLQTVAEWSDSHLKLLEAKRYLEAALRQSEAVEQRLEVALAIADLYVYEVDYASGTFTARGDGSGVLDAQPTFARMDKDPFWNVHADDRAAVMEAWSLAEAAGERFRYEYRSSRPGGPDTWVSSFAEIRRDDQGRPLRVVGALQNITERKLAEINLMLARDAAEAASIAKSEFLANVSHEIRTPLNGVLGMVQVMHRDPLGPVQRGRLNVIRDSGQSLLAILNAVLDIAKIEAGQLELELREFDIAKIAHKALDPFTAVASEKQIGLTIAVAEAAMGVYRGDPTRVGQILHNLVSNAVKFTTSGGVTVTVDRPGDALLIAVSDTGIGFDASQRSVLFEKFKQADTSMTRRFGGTGLGLAIVAELTDRMGGAIEVDSQRGLGSTFKVILPLERVTNPAPDATQAPPSPDDGAALLPPLRILAAEDNAINQLVLRTLLNQAGVDPTVVADGGLAVAAWEAGEWDLILMDVQMPNMDGPTATRAIREREAATGRGPIPIIALTANVMDHQIAAYAEAGMTGFVAKPIEISQLFEAIENALADDAGEIIATAAA